MMITDSGLLFWATLYIYIYRVFHKNDHPVADHDLTYKPKVVIDKISKQVQTETILAKFRQFSTVLVSDNWHYLKQMQLTITFCISQGSAATVFRRCG